MNSTPPPKTWLRQTIKSSPLTRHFSFPRTQRLFGRKHRAVRAELLSLTEQIDNGAALKLKSKSHYRARHERRECDQKVGRAKEELSAVDSKVLEYRHNADRLAAEQIEIINETGEQRNVVSGLKTNLSNGIERLDHDQREIATLESASRNTRKPSRQVSGSLSWNRKRTKTFLFRANRSFRALKRKTKIPGLVEQEKRFEPKSTQASAAKSLKAGRGV